MTLIKAAASHGLLASFAGLSGASLVTILLSVLTNKAIALKLGPEGMGVVGLYSAFVASLGTYIPQLAARPFRNYPAEPAGPILSVQLSGHLQQLEQELLQRGQLDGKAEDLLAAAEFVPAD